jgi:hypothetical protein
MVVIGGMGNIGGSIISATLITYVNTQLQTILTGDLAVLKDIIYALILVLIIIYNNTPALKSFRDRYNVRKLISYIVAKAHRKNENDEARWDVIPTKIEMNEILSVDMKVVESTMEPDKKEVD